MAPPAYQARRTVEAVDRMTRRASAVAVASRSRPARARRRISWRKDPEGRRVRILDAAARLFGEHGFRQVSTGAIAAAADVSEGTVFHHFGSKEHLLFEVAERYGRGFANAMFAGVRPEESLPDPDWTIRRAFAYVRDSDPSFGVFLLSDEPTSPGRARRANRGEIVNTLTRFLESWMERGLVRKLDPHVVAELLFGLVETALKECYARGQQEREEVYVREVAQAIRAMLGAPAPLP